VPWPGLAEDGLGRALAPAGLAHGCLSLQGVCDVQAAPSRRGRPGAGQQRRGGIRAGRVHARLAVLRLRCARARARALARASAQRLVPPSAQLGLLRCARALARVLTSAPRLAAVRSRPRPGARLSASRSQALSSGRAPDAPLPRLPSQQRRNTRRTRCVSCGRAVVGGRPAPALVPGGRRPGGDAAAGQEVPGLSRRGPLWHEAAVGLPCLLLRGRVGPPGSAPALACRAALRSRPCLCVWPGLRGCTAVAPLEPASCQDAAAQPLPLRACPTLADIGSQRQLDERLVAACASRPAGRQGAAGADPARVHVQASSTAAS